MKNNWPEVKAQTSQDSVSLSYPITHTSILIGNLNFHKNVIKMRNTFGSPKENIYNFNSKCSNDAGIGKKCLLGLWSGKSSSKTIAKIENIYNMTDHVKKINIGEDYFLFLWILTALFYSNI